AKMYDFTSLRERIPGISRALAVGIPAGFLFDWLNTPIPWMIGPLIAVAAVNLFGISVYALPYARQTGQVILGSAVALYFTPTVVAALGANFGAIVISTASAFMIGGLGAIILSRVSGIDGKSSFFASIPGGAMAMATLAERFGASIPPVAVAHSLRVSLVIIIVPFAVTYGGIPLDAAAFRPQIPLNVMILIPWLAVGFAIGEISERLGLANGYLLTPIFFGAALTLSGVELSAVPHWMTDIAQLMFGLVLGARYERAFFIRYKLFIPFAFINSFFILVTSALLAVALSWLFGLPIATMLISTAPGGLAEMTITAQALKVGVPLVVAFHLFRVLMINLVTPYLFGLGVRLRRR
ncbi:MAG: AbrB family transcriptional regulator, partial [Alphaproteobacteria bacterium]|nr:AbrB family transcriptional regulator [Alphaproteobacteria bacterium]